MLARERRRAQRRRDREHFDALKARTPHAWVTHALGALNLGVFLVMVLQGVSPVDPESLEVLAFGAEFGPSIVLDDEWWRLVTSSFLHFGILHLVANLWGLWKFGPVVERLYGSAAYLVLCGFAAVLSGLASLAAYPAVVCAGASGVVFGILGAALTAWRKHRREVSAALLLGDGELGCLSLTLAPWRLGGPAGVLYLVVLGLVDPEVSIAGHAGGLLAGIGFGALVDTRLADRRRPRARAVAFALGLALTLLSAVGLRALYRDDATMHLTQARARGLAGDTRGALASAERALELDWMSAEARRMRDHFEEELAGPRGDPRAALELRIHGANLCQRGECAEGLADFERAAEVGRERKPLDPWVRRAYARCLACAGDTFEAMLELGLIVAADPRDAEALEQLGMLLHARGEWKASLDMLLERIEVEPDDDCSLLVWTLRTRLGDSGEADALLRAEVAGREVDDFVQLGGFLLDELSERELLELEPPEDAELLARFRLLAPFLAATRRELRGDLDGARELYRRAFAAGVTSHHAHWLARANLERLGEPGAR